MKAPEQPLAHGPSAGSSASTDPHCPGSASATMPAQHTAASDSEAAPAEPAAGIATKASMAAAARALARIGATGFIHGIMRRNPGKSRQPWTPPGLAYVASTLSGNATHAAVAGDRRWFTL